MKQWQFGDEPGWANLRMQKGETPQPAAGEVLVRIHAASLNYRDKLLITTPSLFRSGLVPLSDGAGDIVAVGEQVTGWQVGDRVAGCFFRDWQSGRFQMQMHQAALGGSIDGVLQSHALFRQDAIVRIPDAYSFEEAATLPCAGLTAWSALIARGRLQPGDSVLALGTGGVSIWALQIAHAVGASVLITSSSDEKLEKASALGASHTVSYKKHVDWEKRIFEMTDQRGVDHVIEVGGAGTLGRSLACVAAGGHVALIGVLTGFDAPNLNVFPLVAKNATVSGIYVGHRESFQQFVRFIEVTQIKPVIDRVFEFEDAIAAYECLESGKHFGKVVIRVT